MFSALHIVGQAAEVPSATRDTDAYPSATGHGKSNEVACVGYIAFVREST